MTADQPAQGTDGLLPCPHCGSALTISSGEHNKLGQCPTAGCAGGRQAVPLDDPKQVAAWNRRSPSPAVAETWAECFDAQRSVIFFLRETLEQIKRDNQQYNFGSKLLRIVDAALAKVPAPPKENDHGHS